jgi:ribosomal protein L21E
MHKKNHELNDSDAASNLRDKINELRTCMIGSHRIGCGLRGSHRHSDGYKYVIDVETSWTDRAPDNFFQWINGIAFSDEFPGRYEVQIVTKDRQTVIAGYGIHIKPSQIDALTRLITDKIECINKIDVTAKAEPVPRLGFGS